MNDTVHDPVDYAAARAKETGRPYLMTKQGHVWVADRWNIKQAHRWAEGIACIWYPDGRKEIQT